MKRRIKASAARRQHLCFQPRPAMPEFVLARLRLPVLVCCRKDQAKTDCCAGLKCTGTCGSDTHDTGTYVPCGGCKSAVAIRLANAPVTPDNMRYLDPNFTDGVCRDCAVSAMIKKWSN